MKFQALVLIQLVLRVSLQQVNYVMPNDSSPQVCPDQPCLTLEQYAQQKNTYFTSGARFLFLSGNHTLELAFKIANISQVTLEGDIATILFKLNGSFEIYSTTQFAIQGLKFTGESVRFANSKDVTVHNCEFFDTFFTVSESESLDINDCYFDGSSIFAFDSKITVSGGRLQANFQENAIKTLYSTIEVSNSLFESTNSEDSERAIYSMQSNVTVRKSNFLGKNNANYSFTGGAIFAQSSTIEVLGCLFEGNSGLIGAAIEANDSEIVIGGCAFIENHAKLGGAIFMLRSTLTLKESLGISFLSNSAEQGGALHATKSLFKVEHGYNSAPIGDSKSSSDSLPLQPYHISFVKNIASIDGGAIFCQTSQVSMHGKNITFADNSAGVGVGGAILAMNNCSLTLGGDTNYSLIFFVNNSANTSGGAIYFYTGNMRLCGCNHFFHNKANHYGGAIFLTESQITITNKASFVNNHATAGGALVIHNSDTSVINGTEITFLNNSASGGGGIYIFNSTVKAENNIFFANNTAALVGGGGIYVDNSLLELSGANITNSSDKGGAIVAFLSNMSITETIFRRNHGLDGGAIRSHYSNISLENTLFESNKAIAWGGAILCVNSEIRTRKNVTFTENQGLHGGAIFADASRIITNCTLNFKANAAILGGAMFINKDSTLTLLPHTNVTTSQNHAIMFGGVIFYEDTVGSQCLYNTFVLDQYTYYTDKLPYCFLRFKNASEISITSYNDTAGKAGSLIYGGFLDRCQMNTRLAGMTVQQPYTLLITKIIHILSATSDNSSAKAIASKPYQLCFCESDLIFNCSQKKTIQTIRGKVFNVSILAVDQGKSSVPSQVHATPINSLIKIKLGQKWQTVFQYCTNLTYNLYSIGSEGILELSNDGSCTNIGVGTAVVDLTFLPCPDGFTQSGEQCVCEERLQVYEVECVIDEDIYIEKKSQTNFWIGMLYNNGSYEGLILYSSCPADYCKKNANFTLDNLDAQCEDNRSDLLCGACKANHSLILGSTQCQECYNYYLVLLLACAIAGLALVIFLSFIRLTVATGMLNSIILYANIIHANKHSVFPSTTANILSVFIAWLNLDLGLQTCFYNGMDAYAQTWLQFAFPLYIWILISLIIIISRYSITMSKLIGHNPIAVLATLLLMSYSKVLKIIIEVYSSVDLDYPGNKTVTVWLKDANVPYLHSKHLVLTVTTTLVLVFFFLPYTLFVLLGHKLYRFSGRKYFGWLRIVKPLLDSYYAPYKIQTRYWTGFLLIIRCVLYIVFSFNYSLGGANRSFMSINITFTALIIIAWLLARVYKSFYINVIEASVYLNLIMLSAASLAGVNGQELVYSLVGTVFATMLGIVIYHFHLLYTVKSSLWLKSKDKMLQFIQAVRERTRSERRVSQEILPYAAITSQDPHRIVTRTVVEVNEPLLATPDDKCLSTSQS